MKTRRGVLSWAKGRVLANDDLLQQNTPHDLPAEVPCTGTSGSCAAASLVAAQFASPRRVLHPAKIPFRVPTGNRFRRAAGEGRCRERNTPPGSMQCAANVCGVCPIRQRYQPSVATGITLRVDRKMATGERRNGPVADKGHSCFVGGGVLSALGSGSRARRGSGRLSEKGVHLSDITPQM